MIVICEECGKEIQTFPCRVGVKKYCSIRCRGQAQQAKTERIDRECPQCKKTFKAPVCQTKHGYYKFCSNACRLAYHRGPNGARYKGGYVRPDGYRQVSYNGKQWLEHDIVWFLNTGIKPDRDHHVHHKDRNKLNNSFDNLVMVSPKEHAGDHPHTVASKEKARAFHRAFVIARCRNEKGQFICTGT